MPTAYLCISVDVGSDEEVLRRLKKVEGVVEAHTVLGVYDIIGKIEIDDMEKLKEVIAQQVRRLKHVRSTQTMIVY